MKVLITACNSFLGRGFGAYLEKKKVKVYGTVRNSDSDFHPHWLEDRLTCSLESPPTRLMLPPVDVIIHLAHDFSAKSAEVNIIGTQRIANSARSANIKTQVYISSYSAREDATSEYGKTKYHLERFFLSDGGVVARPGLILGNGGIFQRMVNLVEKFPVIPLLGGGRGEVPLISLNVLCESLYKILLLKHHKKPDYNIFLPKLITLKALLTTIAKTQGKTRLFVPVPALPLLMMIRMFSMLGIRLPINEDNIRGFVSNQDRVHTSDLELLRMDSMTLDATLAGMDLES